MKKKKLELNRLRLNKEKIGSLAAGFVVGGATVEVTVCATFCFTCPITACLTCVATQGQPQCEASTQPGCATRDSTPRCCVGP